MINQMRMTLEEFNDLPNGEVFRVVTTKHHKDTEYNNPLLTFVCKKGDGGPGDWAIYYHYADKGAAWIAEHGQKLTSTERIHYIMPCDPEVLKLYRR